MFLALRAGISTLVIPANAGIQGLNQSFLKENRENLKKLVENLKWVIANDRNNPFHALKSNYSYS